MPNRRTKRPGQPHQNCNIATIDIQEHPNTVVFLSFLLHDQKKRNQRKVTGCVSGVAKNMRSLEFRRRQNSLRSNSISAYRNSRSIFDTRHNAGSSRPDNPHNLTLFSFEHLSIRCLNAPLRAIHFGAVACKKTT